MTGLPFLFTRNDIGLRSSKRDCIRSSRPPARSFVRPSVRSAERLPEHRIIMLCVVIWLRPIRQEFNIETCKAGGRG